MRVAHIRILYLALDIYIQTRDTRPEEDLPMPNAAVGIDFSQPTGHAVQVRLICVSLVTCVLSFCLASVSLLVDGQVWLGAS